MPLPQPTNRRASADLASRRCRNLQLAVSRTETLALQQCREQKHSHYSSVANRNTHAMAVSRAETLTLWQCREQKHSRYSSVVNRNTLQQSREQKHLHYSSDAYQNTCLGSLCRHPRHTGNTWPYLLSPPARCGRSTTPVTRPAVRAPSIRTESTPLRAKTWTDTRGCVALSGCWRRSCQKHL